VKEVISHTQQCKSEMRIKNDGRWIDADENVIILIDRSEDLIMISFI
jgi:hypothetical protein